MMLSLILISLIIALWFGFFIEKSYKQYATYNLIGKAAKRRISPKSVTVIVNSNFSPYNWILLSISIFFFSISIGLIFKVGEYNKILLLLFFSFSAITFIACLVRMTLYYISSDKELFGD